MGQDSDALLQAGVVSLRQDEDTNTGGSVDDDWMLEPRAGSTVGKKTIKLGGEGPIEHYTQVRYGSCALDLCSFLPRNGPTVQVQAETDYSSNPFKRQAFPSSGLNHPTPKRSLAAETAALAIETPPSASSSSSSAFPARKRGSPDSVEVEITGDTFASMILSSALKHVPDIPSCTRVVFIMDRQAPVRKRPEQLKRTSAGPKPLVNGTVFHLSAAGLSVDGQPAAPFLASSVTATRAMRPAILTWLGVHIKGLLETGLFPIPRVQEVVLDGWFIGAGELETEPPSHPQSSSSSSSSCARAPPGETPVHRNILLTRSERNINQEERVNAGRELGIVKPGAMSTTPAVYNVAVTRGGLLAAVEGENGCVEYALRQTQPVCLVTVDLDMAPVLGLSWCYHTRRAKKSGTSIPRIVAFIYPSRPGPKKTKFSSSSSSSSSRPYQPSTTPKGWLGPSTKYVCDPLVATERMARRGVSWAVVGLTCCLMGCDYCKSQDMMQKVGFKHRQLVALEWVKEVCRRLKIDHSSPGLTQDEILILHHMQSSEGGELLVEIATRMQTASGSKARDNFDYQVYRNNSLVTPTRPSERILTGLSNVRFQLKYFYMAWKGMIE